MQKFTFDKDFQVGILALMTQSFEFLLTGIDLIEPQYFEDQSLVWMFQTIKNYYIDYKLRPTILVLENELKKAVSVGKIKEENIQQYRDVFIQFAEPVNAEKYVISEVVRFCRRQEVRKAMLEMAPYTESQDPDVWDKIESRIQKACSVGSHAIDIGCQYFLEYPERLKARILGEEQHVVPTGITDLDTLIGGGLKAGQLGIWLGGTGVGKCLKKGTLVLMYDGRRLPVENVVVGDVLMGPDSKPRRVLQTVSGVDDLVTITPNKGSQWVCTKDHILTLVHTSKDKVIDISVDEYLKKNNKFKHCHKQFSVGVDFPALENPLPIDPYFLGLWFGNGTKSLGNKTAKPIPAVCITSMEPEVHQAIYDIADDYGKRVRVEDDWHGKASALFITGREWIGGCTRDGGRNANSFLDLLRSVVGPNASVPYDYFVSSRGERAAFLAGFLDTDGYLFHGCYEICQKRNDYADAICFIARSLGLRVTTRIKMVDGSPYNRMIISGDLEIIPCRVLRRQVTNLAHRKDAKRTGITITSAGLGEYAGFTLDGDGRFLLGDFTVTHNSISLPHCGKRAVVNKLKVVHYTLELNEEDIAQRYDSSWTNVPIHELSSQPQLVEKRLHDANMRYGNSLIIKYYPSGTATVGTLRQHLTALKNYGFIPDLVVVDYLDLIKPSTSYNDEYADLGAITLALRGLAGELKVPLWTACQVNRPGMSQEVVDVEHISDSFRKAQIADIVIAICSTREEHEMEIRRLFLAKNRNGPSKRTVKIRSAYNRMCFYTTSSPVSGEVAISSTPVSSRRKPIESGAPSLPPKPRRKPLKK